MSTEQRSTSVALDLIATVLNNHRTAGLIQDQNGHSHALGLVGEMVPHTTDPDYVTRVIAACLPSDYSGDTLREIPRMIRDSVKNGYAEKVSKKTALPRSAVALNIIESEGLTLFHTQQKKAFASVTTPDGGTICTPVQSEEFKTVVRYRYFRSTGKTLSKDALNEILDLLEAKALFESSCDEVHVRCGGTAEAIYYDLGRTDGKVIMIDKHGWRLVDGGPLHFYRPPDFLPQVEPASGGTLRALAQALNFDQHTASLLLAFLINCLMPEGPYMILLVGGEHGSGKSLLCSVIRRIIDPNLLDRLTLPRDEHTLAILATQHRVLVFDNASHIKWDISDALCRQATGAAFGIRRFYSDDNSRTFKSSRPIVINGIGQFADRPDLMDRAIQINLQNRADGRLRTERSLNGEIDRLLPAFLGALFDVMSCALKRLDEVEPPTTIRMADAAQWLVAAEPATGFAPGTFVKALETGLEDMLIEKASNDPLVIVLLKFFTKADLTEYNGTFGDLHDRLKLVDDEHKFNRHLPQTPAYLSSSIQRLRPAMAKIGLMVDLPRRNRNGQRVRVWLEPNEQRPAVSVHANKLTGPLLRE